jgi:hypothetical protein
MILSSQRLTVTSYHRREGREGVKGSVLLEKVTVNNRVLKSSKGQKWKFSNYS